jgi:hypothetical protein
MQRLWGCDPFPAYSGRAPSGWCRHGCEAGLAQTGAGRPRRALWAHVVLLVVFQRPQTMNALHPARKPAEINPFFSQTVQVDPQALHTLHNGVCHRSHT